MQSLKKYRWLFLIVLLLAALWHALPRRVAPPATRLDMATEASLSRPKMDRSNMEPVASEPGRIRSAAKDPLANVRSPLARRYLRFMLPGGRLDGESHDQSIVNNAFKQAWGVTARIELSEAQQDQLAGFLLQEDWSKWSTMNPKRVEKWAEEHLSGEQTEALMAFIRESRQGERNLSDMRMELKKQEYGVGTAEEAFDAEMRESARIAEMLARNGENLPEEEAAKMREELKRLMKTANGGEGDAGGGKVAESRKDEQAGQFFHLLADRIPMTEEQQLALYQALRAGSVPPVNPYDYQSRSEERIEADVKSATAWMGELLTKEQYETYLRHFLAEIEMIRFQVSR